jgi:hypothetical protein
MSAALSRQGLSPELDGMRCFVDAESFRTLLSRCSALLLGRPATLPSRVPRSSQGSLRRLNPSVIWRREVVLYGEVRHQPSHGQETLRIMYRRGVFHNGGLNAHILAWPHPHAPSSAELLHVCCARPDFGSQPISTMCCSGQPPPHGQWMMAACS